jgi:23S rRNA (cytidine1920-2'-O)/16S rRNA (cytidine1409-2'-O)-methyltransferase
MPLRRLDAELVRRKLVKSREEAKVLIEGGSVKVGGVISEKPTRQVDENVSIVLEVSAERYVSRGAYKLIGALDKFAEFGLTPKGKFVLDAGASTGGFTQVCLELGAERVAAVDVGYGQIAWSLRTDPRVEVIERFNIRYLKPSDLAFEPNLIVADLSFISLTTVLPALAASVATDADFVLMVKPQFEVGKQDIGDGVVTDPDLRVNAVLRVIAAAESLGLNPVALGASPLPGPSGNVEYFVWLKRGASPRFSTDIESEIRKVVAEGPQ